MGKGHTYTLWAGTKSTQTPLKAIWRFATKTEMDMPRDLATSLLGVCFKGLTHNESKRCLHHHMYNSTIHSDQNSETTKVPTVTRIKKMWSIHTVKQYSVMKKRSKFYQLQHNGLNWRRLD